MHGTRMGIILISPGDFISPLVYRLAFYCTINIIKYEALILVLKAIINMELKNIHIYGDSHLIFN